MITKETTLQDLFDDAARHMIEQGSRAINDLGLPAYKSRDGRCGPIGFLLGDKYEETIENHSLEDVVGWLYRKGETEVAELFDGRRADNYQFNLKILKALQSIHDNKSPHRWQQNLYWLARWARLNPKVVKL